MTLKRCGLSIVALFLCICFATPSVFATTSVSDLSTFTIELENGDYIEVSTTVTASPSRSSKSRTAAERSYSYISFSGNKLFKYILYGEFEYDGTSSRATYVDYGIEIYDAGWDVENHLEYASGSSVYGAAKFNGPLFRTETLSGSITCDKNGKIS